MYVGSLFNYDEVISYYGKMIIFLLQKIPPRNLYEKCRQTLHREETSGI